MIVVERSEKHAIVETESGVRLDVIPVRKLPIQDLLYKLGVTERVAKGNASVEEIQAAIINGSPTQQMQTAKAAMALFGYCMGYGVVNDPPAEAVEELRAMNLAPDNPRALRTTWLNYMVLEDGDEAGRLAGVIMALTFGKEIATAADQDDSEADS